MSFSATFNGIRYFNHFKYSVILHCALTDKTKQSCLVSVAALHNFMSSCIVSGNQSAVQAQLISLQARQAGQTAQNATASSSTALPAKLAKNKRLPATMVTPAGHVDVKKKGGKQVGKKQRKRLEEGKEKAVERSGKTEERVKGREDRKVGRNRYAMVQN